MTVPSHDEIQRAAGTFLDVAFESLAKLRVVPTPIYHPHLEVGRDYSGSAVGNLQEFRDLEAALDQAYPERFDEATAGLESDFSSHWIYSLLEASVARCSIRGEQLASSSPAVGQTIDELITVLSEPLASVIVCRAAPHLATEDGQPLTICDLEILPNADGRQMIPQIIPLGASAFNRDPPFVYDPPQALIVARDHGSNPYQTASEASARIDTFLLAIRLLYASTAWTAYEVQGPASLVDPTGARLTTANRDRSLVRRTLRLGPEHGAPVTALTAVLDGANAVPAALMFTSFGMALTRFSESYQGNTWDGQLLSLTTALEGAISGSETNDVILRLRTRAAALLAEDDDPPVNIFEDIGRIYELRSKLAHGGTYKIDRFKSVVYKMSTVPEEAPLGVAVGYMIDRLRDLVRRAILARLFLAARDEPLWALSDDLGVDAHLTNDATRATWKSAWRASLAEIGAPESPMRASLAQNYLSREDR